MPFHNVLIHAYLSVVDNKLLVFFVWSVILDIGTGIAKGFINKRTGRLNSTKGLFGLVKHGVVLALVLVIFPFMNVVGFESPANALVLYYTTTYWISIVENLGQMGVPFPVFIKKYFEKLQDNYNQGGHNDKTK